MDNSTWIATIAGIALGIGIILAFVVFKKNQPSQAETGMMYNYDDDNRLQSITPMGTIKLKAIG